MHALAPRTQLPQPILARAVSRLLMSWRSLLFATGVIHSAEITREDPLYTPPYDCLREPIQDSRP
jgi:hypothetical protein